MQHKINLMQFSLEQIMRKVKSFKNDSNLIGLTLIVKRKDSMKSHKNIKSRQGQPSNVEVLMEQRRMNKQKNNEQNQSQPEYGNKQGCKKGGSIEIYGKKQIIDNSEQTENYQFINDNRITKAKKNYVQGNYDTAIDILTSLLQQIKENKLQGDVEGEKQRKKANISFLLANCYYRKKNYEKAIQYYSIQIAQQNYKHKAMRKSNLGAIFLHLKKNQESLRNYTQALKIYSQCGCEDVDLSNTYHNVGNIYLRQKMYDIASKYFQMSIQERKFKSPQSELPLFYSAFKLGISQKFQQKYEESIKSLFYALSFAERGVGDVIQVFKQIAFLYELIGKPNDALNYYEKICDNGKATEEDKGYAYQRAGIIYMKQSQQGEGQRIMKIAYQCYERSGNQRKVSYIRQNYKMSSVLI